MTELSQTNEQEQQEEVFLLYRQSLDSKQYLSQIHHEAQGLQKLLQENNPMSLRGF